MRKFLVLALIVVLAMPSMAFAARKTNLYASWVTAQPWETSTFTMPIANGPKDIIVHNTTDEQLCVGLDGDDLFNSLGDGTLCKGVNNVVLDANSDFELYDFDTASITVTTFGAKASPVSVVVTY